MQTYTFNELDEHASQQAIIKYYREICNTCHFERSPKDKNSIAMIFAHGYLRACVWRFTEHGERIA